MVDGGPVVAVRFDYSRGGRQVSLRGKILLLMRPAALAAVAPLLAAGAQYPGQVAKPGKDAPDLRAVAVLEWTGEAGHPKASRIVPVSVFDGQILQDGGIYLARPQPLALSGEVEYELKQNGRTIGLFDLNGAGQEQGSWVGFGAWKPLPAAHPSRPAAELARSGKYASWADDAQSDRPVLHRKAHSGDAPGTDSGSAKSGSAGQPPASDPDRPTLHKKTTSDSTGDSSTADANSTPASDPDRPALHKKTASDDSASGSAPAGDPDRPTLKKSKKKQPEDVGRVESLPDVTDPDRPRLKRGKSTGDSVAVVPTLMGLPPDMRQAVAVSDAKDRPEHLWSFAWSNPEDELKMKSALEDLARAALGLNPPPPPAAPRRTASRKKSAPPPPPPPPAPLLDEQFRVFELAYSSGATLVLTAHTDGADAQEKFVTLVAQPDLYGNLLVLLKSVTDSAHLDEKPRMRLVDAVDALADNRGELLFELRGSTQRQFALYRVLRGQADKLFVTGAGDIALRSNE
jgi:hypothetical protein